MSSAYDTQALARASIVRFFPLRETVGAGTVADLTSNADHLTVNGGITLGSTTIVVGDGETAAVFNGSTGYLQATSQLITAVPFRLSVILKTSSASSQAVFFTRDVHGFDVNINADGTLTWYWSATGGASSITTDITTGSWIDGVAHQLDLIGYFDATNSVYVLQIWRDNVLVMVGTTTYNPVATSGTVAAVFGNRFGVQFFAGTMQKIALYNQAIPGDIFLDRIPFVGETPAPAPTLPLCDAVPYSWPAPGDPLRANFDDLLTRGMSGVIRGCMIGDSTMSIPGGGGRANFPQFLIALGRLFGSVAGTPLQCTGAGMDGVFSSGANGPGVLATRIVTSLGATCQVPPGPPLGASGLQPLVSMSNLGPLTLISPSNVFTTCNDLTGLSVLPASGFTIELVGAANVSSGEIAYQNVGTIQGITSYTGNLIAPAGMTSMGLQQAVPSGRSVILSQQIPNWTPGPYTSVQVRTVCQDGFAQADYIGFRILNPGANGIILDDFSGGGYAAFSWFGRSTDGTGVLHGACHDFMAAMRHDVIFVNLGRNDQNQSTPAQFIANLYSPLNAGLFAAGLPKGLLGEIDAAYARAGQPLPLYVVSPASAGGDDGTTGRAVSRGNGEQYASALLSLAQSFPTANGASRMLFVNSQRITRAWGWSWQGESIAGVLATTDRGAWAATTAYVVNDLVAAFVAGQPPYYRCIKGHTADGTNQPGLVASSTAFVGFWQPVRVHTSDGVHPGPIGGTKEANAIVAGFAGHDLIFPPPSGPSQTTAYLTTRDAQGDLLPSITLTFQLLDAQTGIDSYDQTDFTATSDSSALLQVPLLKNARYQARVGSGAWVPFTTGSAPTFALPEVLGSYV